MDTCVSDVIRSSCRLGGLSAEDVYSSLITRNTRQTQSDELCIKKVGLMVVICVQNVNIM